MLKDVNSSQKIIQWHEVYALNTENLTDFTNGGVISTTRSREQTGPADHAIGKICVELKFITEAKTNKHGANRTDNQ